MRKSDHEPEPRLPIKLDPVSNCEFLPSPVSNEVRAVQRLAFERASEHARHKGVDRRRFLQSSSGVATVLGCMNTVFGCNGGSYRVNAADELDEETARANLGQGEFIFDVQTHRVSVDRDWHERNSVFRNLASSRESCAQSWLDCYTSDHFIKEIFLDSDTQVAVLSAVPGGEGKLPLQAREAAETRELADKMSGSGRLLIHGIAQPKVHPMEEVLEQMQELHERWHVAGFKLYPVWGSDGKGWWLDDEGTGIRVIERARSLGVRTLAIHKGLPQPGMDPTYTRPRDVGPVASAYPDMSFLIYHSGYEQELQEGPYDSTAERGVDALIRSLEENGIGSNGNVYAEMGVLWRELRTRREFFELLARGGH